MYAIPKRVPRVRALGVFALAALIVATFSTSPSYAEQHENEAENPGLENPQPDIRTECSFDTNAIVAQVSPRSNLSRHHGAAFVEWQIIHNSDPVSMMIDELSFDFALDRSTDGGFSWTELTTVPNDPDRYHEFDIEGALLELYLDSVRYQGRQLSHYDDTITWPARYPGDEYLYRVAIPLQESDGTACYAIASIDDPVKVQDPTPTTCVAATHDADALESVFTPNSGVTEDGWTITWNGVTADNAAHSAAAPAGQRPLPYFVLQRSDGVGDDAYFKSIAFWANDAWGAARGRAMQDVDEAIEPGAAYTYRVVAVYGRDCGVSFTMDPVTSVPTACTTVGNQYRDLRREMRPRRGLAGTRGIAVTWQGVGNTTRALNAAPTEAASAGINVPTSFSLQRISLPPGSDVVPTDDDWLTVAGYDNSGGGSKLKHVDASARRGYEHQYRVIAVYGDVCGVQTRPTTPIVRN